MWSISPRRLVQSNQSEPPPVCLSFASSAIFCSNTPCCPLIHEVFWEVRRDSPANPLPRTHWSSHLADRWRHQLGRVGERQVAGLVEFAGRRGKCAPDERRLLGHIVLGQWRAQP